MSPNPYYEELTYLPLDGPASYTPRQLSKLWNTQTAYISALISFGRLPAFLGGVSGRASIATADVILWLDWHGYEFPKGERSAYRKLIASRLSLIDNDRWLAENRALDRVAAKFTNAD